MCVSRIRFGTTSHSCVHYGRTLDIDSSFSVEQLANVKSKALLHSFSVDGCFFFLLFFVLSINNLNLSHVRMSLCMCWLDVASHIYTHALRMMYSNNAQITENSHACLSGVIHSIVATTPSTPMIIFIFLLYLFTVFFYTFFFSVSNWRFFLCRRHIELL